MSEEENKQENNNSSSADTSSASSDAGQQKAVVKHVVAPPPPPPPAGRVSPFVSTKKDKKNSSSNKEKTSASSGKWDKNFAADLKLPPSILTTRNMSLILCGVLAVGLLMGFIVFSGGNSCPPCTDSVFGVVKNPEVPRGTKRCGIAGVDEHCRLFVVNAKRSEINVKELFPLAVQFTNIPAYRIDSMNIRYANEIIKPGYIAEIFIPAAAR